jgi:hypothetical protein
MYDHGKFQLFDTRAKFMQHGNIGYGVAAGALAVGILLWIIGD